HRVPRARCLERCGDVARAGRAPRERDADDLSREKRAPVRRRRHRGRRGRGAHRIFSGRARVIAAFILALAASSVSGVVPDSSGGIVAGAVVSAKSSGGATERQVVTGADGRFTIDVPDTGEIVLTVRAGGFAETARSVTMAERGSDISLVLAPATILEMVMVT